MKDSQLRRSICISQMAAYLRALRFRSWISWLFVFGLGSVLFGFPSYKVIPIAISFSFFTAAGFIINQYFDFESDVSNPEKKNLPIASREISKEAARNFFIVLLVSGFLLILTMEVNLAGLFLVYFTLGIMYSVPPFRFKKRPLLDLITIGVVSGILPLLIGLQVSNWLGMDLSSFWMQRRYQDAFISVVPIFLFQISGHIFQSIGDYYSDEKNKIETFVVKYGKDKSAKVGTILFCSSIVLPIFYGLFNLSLNKEFLTYYLILSLIPLPFIAYLLNLFRKPNNQNIALISKIINKITPFLLPFLFICIIIIRSILH